MTPVTGLYDDKVQPRRTLWWAILALVTVDLVFFSGASNYLAAPQSRILDQLIVLGFGAVGAVLAWQGRLEWQSPLVLPGIAVIAATALATLTSQRPEASREALALVLLAAPVYLVVRAILADPWLRSRIDWLVIVSGLVFTVAYLLQALSQWILFWSVAGLAVPPLRPGDVGLTVGTVNAVSLYLELLVPIGLWLAWTRWGSRRFVVAYGLLAALALVITGSRGAWLGVLVGVVALALLVWVDRGRPRPRLGRLTRQGQVTLAAATVLGIVGVVVFGPALLTRLAGGDAGRFELWSAAWSMFTGHPVTGVGPGAWPGLRPSTPITEGVLAVLYTAHSSVLQVLAELGIVGAAAVGWLVLTVARVGWRSMRSATSPADRTLRGVILATLAAFAVHSLVDTQTHIPAVVALLLLLVARLDPARDPTAEPSRASRPAWVPAIALAAPVALGLALLVPIDIAMIRAEAGNLLLDRGDPGAAAIEFDAAIDLHDLPVYRLGQAIARSSLGDDNGAVEALTRMEEREPFTFVASAKASLIASMATAALAETGLTSVEAAGAYDPTAMLQVAIIRATTGEGPTTTGDLAAVMTAVPSLIHSTPPGGLFTDATWSAAQRGALAALRAIDPTVAAAEAIQAGLADDAATARALVTDPGQLELLDILDGGTSDVDRAVAILRSDASSLQVQGLVWAIGFVARSQSTIDAAGRVAGVVNFATPQAPMEIVLDGRVNADWSLRLPRYPNAASSRLGPDRPYLPGLATIEPVFRPKP